LAIGKHLIALGLHQEAQGFFEKVFTDSGSLFYLSEACLDLADLHEIRGDVDIAKQVLEKGLQLLAECPTHPAVAQIRRRLETLQ
jgi:tetratricopeptide (TPR) repeat protein